jgi:hypothetical protein
MKTCTRKDHAKCILKHTSACDKCEFRRDLTVEQTRDINNMADSMDDVNKEADDLQAQNAKHVETIPRSDRDDGLTETEGSIMDHLVAAWGLFGSLEVQHPIEREEFANYINALQGILAIRIARREHPLGWPSYT